MMTYQRPLPAKRIFVALFCFVIYFAGLMSQAQVLSLDDDHTVKDLYDEMAPVTLEGFDINDPEHRARALLEAAAPEAPRGEYVEPDTWTVATIVNASSEPQIIRLNIYDNNLAGVAIYEERREQIAPTLDFSSEFTPISARPAFDTQIASRPIHLAPGEQINIWAYFEISGWTSWIGLHVIEEQTYVRERKFSWAGYAMYFGSACVLIAFFFVFSFLLKSAPAAWYGAFFAGLLATNAYVTSFMQLFLYPEYTWLNLYMLRPLQLFVVIAHLMFVSAFLKTAEHYPKFHKVILFFCALGIIITVAENLVWSPLFSSIASAYGLTFVFTGLWGAWLALRDKLKGATLFAVGVAILFFTLVISLASIWMDYDSAGWRLIGVLSVNLQFVDGLVFAGAIIRQTFALRADRDSALRAELRASNAELVALQERATAERDRDSARRLAARHRERLEYTSHDLLQPLTSLQMALREGDLGSPETKAKLATGLDYLNTVLGDTLEGVREGDAHFTQIEQKAEPVPIQVVFDNLSRMFAAEADKQRLNLKFRASAAIVKTDTIGLIRALSNLVSNALKYTSDGDILVAARRRDGAIRIEVHDAGAGLDPAALARVLKKGERGAPDGDVSGTGLGLAIVAEWAEKNGLSFDARSQPGRGSVFFIGGLERA
jgi:signal transduction histidine kinase